MRHLITNACLLTADPDDRVIDGGFLLIDGERIAAIGPMSQVPEGPFEQVTDAGGDFVTPGLINLHEHEYMHILKGITEGELLENWSRRVVVPTRKQMDADDILAAGRMAALEMLASGTTCALMHPSRAGQTCLERGQPTYNLGIGVRMAHGIFYQIRTPKLPDHPFGPTEAGDHMRHLDRLYRAAPGQMNLVAAMIECNAHHTQQGQCTDELVLAGNEVTKELDLPVASHMSGGTLSMQMGFLKYKRATGRSDVDYLDSLGVLDRRWLLVHGIHFTDGDIAKVARSGASAIYTPTSENFRGGGTGPWVQMRAAGIPCALGTDGPAVDYSMDMVEQAKAVVLFQNARHRRAGAMDARFALRMATINGARALGAGDWLGSLEPGKRADVAVFRRRRATQWMIEDPVESFVLATHGADARLVLVNGNVSYEDGHFRDGVDAQAIISEARDRARHLHQRTGLHVRARPIWPEVAA